MATLSTLQATFSGMQNSNRRCEMEMALIKLCSPEISTDLASLETRIRALEAGAPVKSAVKSEKPAATMPINPAVTEDYDEIPLPESPDEPAADAYNESSQPAREEKNVSAPMSGGDTTPVEDWDEILSILRTTCPIIAGVLNGSKAYTKGAYLLIDTASDQFRTLVNGDNPIYRDSIRKAAAQILGNTYKLGPYKAPEKAAADPLTQFAEKLKQLEKNN